MHGATDRLNPPCEAATQSVLSRLSPPDVAGYLPYWVTLARAETASGHRASALQSLERAIGLTEDPAVRAYLSTLSSQPPESGTER